VRPGEQAVRGVVVGERPAHRVRVKVGQGVHHHRAVLVRQQHRAPDVGDPGPQVHALAHQAGREAEPDGGVVVAGGHDHGSAFAQPGQGVRQQLDGLDGRDRPVVYVTGDDDRADAL